LIGKLDRRKKDLKATGQTIYIVRGPLKGYKGRIVFADDFSATIQIFAKGNIQVTVDRDAITSIQDDTQAMRLQDQAPMQISFDEAMGQEFVNVPLDELGNPIVSRPMDLEDGGATPVREDIAQEW
jgi:transcription elongation factor